MKGHVKEGAAAISLIKGINITDSGLGLISDEIREALGIDVSVLMGANIANEVARDQFCESTVGGFGENAKVLSKSNNFSSKIGILDLQGAFPATNLPSLHLGGSKDC